MQNTDFRTKVKKNQNEKQQKNKNKILLRATKLAKKIWTVGEREREREKQTDLMCASNTLLTTIEVPCARKLACGRREMPNSKVHLPNKS